MVSLASLWLPILLSAVAVFIVSSALHMALPWHQHDYKRLPNQEAFREAWNQSTNAPGDYMVPAPPAGETMRESDFAAKHKEGPVIVMTVMPHGDLAMGRPLILWFIYTLVISLLSAFTAAMVFPAGAIHQVFHVMFMTSFLGYAGALWQGSIWFRRSWATAVRSSVDGIIFGLVTAGIFFWLWPR